jgi:hypothetical protein
MSHRTMRRTAMLLSPALAGLVFAGAAQAATPAKPLTLTLRDSTIVTQGDAVGDSQLTAGLIWGTFGSGVESIHDKVTAVSTTEITFRGVVKLYVGGATLSGPITIHIFPQPNGSATGKGTGTLNHGTGRLAGLHAQFTFHGSESPTFPVFTSHATGTFTR